MRSFTEGGSAPLRSRSRSASSAVASTSVTRKKCGMSRAASCIRRAMARRVALQGSRRGVSAAAVPAAAAGAVAGAEPPAAPSCEPPRAARSTSSCRMRPFGPLPRRPSSDTPRLSAKRRTGGLTRTTPASGAAPVGAAMAGVVGDVVTAADAAVSPVSGGRKSRMKRSRSSSEADASAITPISVPTAAMFPASSRMRRNIPSAGASRLLTIFSDSISISGSPRATMSPGCLSQDDTVPSVISRPHLGTTTATMRALMRGPLRRQR